MSRVKIAKGPFTAVKIEQPTTQSRIGPVIAEVCSVKKITSVFAEPDPLFPPGDARRSGHTPPGRRRPRPHALSVCIWPPLLYRESATLLRRQKKHGSSTPARYPWPPSIHDRAMDGFGRILLCSFPSRSSVHESRAAPQTVPGWLEGPICINIAPPKNVCFCACFSMHTGYANI
jgi:hypothetical protein